MQEAAYHAETPNVAKLPFHSVMFSAHTTIQTTAYTCTRTGCRRIMNATTQCTVRSRSIVSYLPARIEGSTMPLFDNSYVCERRNENQLARHLQEQSPRGKLPRTVSSVVHVLRLTSICKIWFFAYLYEEPFVVVSHVVYSGRESRLKRLHSNRVDGEILHEKLVKRETTGSETNVEGRSIIFSVHSSRVRHTHEI